MYHLYVNYIDRMYRSVKWLEKELRVSARLLSGYKYQLSTLAKLQGPLVFITILIRLC